MKDLKIVQDQHYQGEDWWTWSVWLDGPALADVQKVVWKLHPTFPEPERTETDATKNFRLDTSGWGTFRVRADVVLKSGKVEKLQHDLELLYPDGSATEK